MNQHQRQTRLIRKQEKKKKEASRSNQRILSLLLLQAGTNHHLGFDRPIKEVTCNSLRNPFIAMGLENPLRTALEQASGSILDEGFSRSRFVSRLLSICHKVVGNILQHQASWKKNGPLRSCGRIKQS